MSEFNELLIEAVKSCPCLYDKENKGYLDKNIKNECWNEIASKINKSPEECKTRWRHLRETFSRKCNRKDSDSADQNVWLYFKLLLFLKPFIQRRKVRNGDTISPGGRNESSFQRDELTFDSEDFASIFLSEEEPVSKRKRKSNSALKVIEEADASYNESKNIMDSHICKAIMCLVAEIPSQNKDKVRAELLQFTFALKEKYARTNLNESEDDEIIEISKNQQKYELDEGANEKNKKIFKNKRLIQNVQQDIDEQSIISDSKGSVVMERWDAGKILKFLDKYRELPCLWNVTDQDYRKRETRLFALQTLIEYMDVPKWSVQQMERRIKSIRDAYFNEKRRVLKIKQLGQKYVPKLIFYKQADKFLGKTIMISKHFDESFIEDESMYIHKSKEFNESNEINDELNNSDQGKCSLSVKNEELTIFGKRGYPESAISDSKKCLDEFSLFGKYLSQQLNLLPPTKAYKLEVEFQRLLSNAKIETLYEPQEIIF